MLNCFFCLGISSCGMAETDYKRITYDITIAAAETLSRLNAGMTFIYVSGAGTDSSERGRVMWARIKGRTENAATGPVLSLLHALVPGLVMTTEEIGRAMLVAARRGAPKRILESRDISALASSHD